MNDYVDCQTDQPDLSELGYEYASIVLRQETGKDRFGDPVPRRYIEGDLNRQQDIELAFAAAKDYTLQDYVENAMQDQQDALAIAGKHDRTEEEIETRLDSILTLRKTVPIQDPAGPGGLIQRNPFRYKGAWAVSYKNHYHRLKGYKVLDGITIFILGDAIKQYAPLT